MFPDRAGTITFRHSLVSITDVKKFFSMHSFQMESSISHPGFDRPDPILATAMSRCPSLSQIVLTSSLTLFVLVRSPQKDRIEFG